jgi:uncharacterized membrane protein
VHGGPHQIWWDIGFLILGAVLVAAGYWMQRTGAPFDPEQSPEPSGTRGRPQTT